MRITVAATKNRRGRPADQMYADAVKMTDIDKAYSPDVSPRTIQNSVNVEEFTGLLIDLERHDLYWFFVKKYGGMQRKGIAEQIGRMMREGLITDDQAIIIAQICKDAYAKGKTSKEIEKRLRQNRLIKKRALRDNAGKVTNIADDFSCNF